MALTADQLNELETILTEHPDWTTSQVRSAAGLPNTALFAVKRHRRALGIPEPASAGQSEKKPPRRRGRSSPDVESATLDGPDDVAAVSGHPGGPKRSQAGKRPQSLLAPILPRLAQAIMAGLVSGTTTLTGGVAPMTREEAAGVAIPAVRIADRTAAKYLKKSGKVTPNQEDAALIALTIVFWVMGWMVASISGKARAGGPRSQPAQAQPEAFTENDLFAGSEPSGPSQARPSAIPYPPAMPVATSISADDAADEGDLFAGSEPLGPGATPSAAQLMRQPAAAAAAGDPAKRPGISEQMWQAIMPSDLGEGLVS